MRASGLIRDETWAEEGMGRGLTEGKGVDWQEEGVMGKSEQEDKQHWWVMESGKKRSNIINSALRQQWTEYRFLRSSSHSRSLSLWLCFLIPPCFLCPQGAGAEGVPGQEESGGGSDGWRFGAGRRICQRHGGQSGVETRAGEREEKEKDCRWHSFNLQKRKI